MNADTAHWIDKGHNSREWALREGKSSPHPLHGEVDDTGGQIFPRVFPCKKAINHSHKKEIGSQMSILGVVLNGL
jgi:hypothetical protein